VSNTAPFDPRLKAAERAREKWAISRSVTAPPRPVRELVAALREVGVSQGDVLLVHCGLNGIGPVEGGAHGVIRALTEAVGPSGTLVMPAFTEGNSDTSWAFQCATRGLSKTELVLYQREMEPFDPMWTPVSPAAGALSEWFRRMPGTARSSHPQSSFTAAGLLAQEILRHHSPTSHFGEQSPLARLCSLPDAKVLMMGTPFTSFTAFHLAEYLQPEPGTRQYRCVIQDGLGRAMWFAYEDVYLDLADFDRIGAAMVDAVAMGTGMIGRARTRLVPLSPAVSFAADWMTRNRMEGRATI